MNVKLNSLAITNFDSNDLEKIKFVKELKEDNLISQFLYGCIDKMIEASEKSENFVLGYGYIVLDKDNLIGFIRPARIIDNSTLDIDYAVKSNYRHQGYGTKILEEASEYFFKNSDEIENIKLFIDSENVNSMSCAEKAGFIKTTESYSHLFSTYIKRR